MTLPALTQWDRQNFLKHAPWLLILLGATLRLLYFGEIPPGLNQDEASIGYEAFALAEFGVSRNSYAFPVHFISWGSGQNALYAYFSIPFIKLFGLNVVSVRLVNVIFGIVTLFAFFGLLRRLTDRETALIGLALLALNPWHIMLSRWALEANLLPAMVVLATYCFSRINDNHTWLWAAAALYGLGLYSYGTAYVFTAIFVPFLAIIYYRQVLSVPGLIAGILFAMISLPIMGFMVVNILELESISTLFLSIPRLSGEPRYTMMVSLFSSEMPGRVLGHARELINILFIRRTDGQPWNAIAPYGWISVICLPFILHGLVLAIVRIFRGQARREHLLIVGWIVAAMVVGVLAPPNINRINIIFLPLIMCAALSLRFVVRVKVAVGSLLVFACVAPTALFAHYYFTEYPKHTEAYIQASMKEAVEYVLQNTEESTPVIVTSRANQPYIYVLFASRYDPRQYRATVHFRRLDVQFQNVLSFGRWRFGIPRRSTAPEVGTAYVLHNSEISLFNNERHTIHYFKNYSVALPRR